MIVWFVYMHYLIIKNTIDDYRISNIKTRS